MSASVGEIKLDLKVNKKSFEKQVSGINNLAKKTGALLAGAFGVNKLVQFGNSCIELGSDLQEVQNVVDVTFPAMSKKVDEFAKNAQAAFGLSETVAKQFTGTYGSMAKAFGFSEEAAYDMSTALTGLAGDVASFYNLSHEEAYTKLKAVFTGETESLKDLGVVMSQTALDSYALANGFGKTTAEMTEAEKVALRYKFVQEQLSAAAGDFTRTSDGWANQVRVLSLQFDSLKATVGQGLINLFTPVINLVNTLIGKLNSLAETFKSFTEFLTGSTSSDSNLSSSISEAELLTDTVAGVGDAAEKSAKKMRSLAGFDEIQKLGSSNSSESSSTTSTGGAADTSSSAQPVSEKNSTGWLDKLKSKFDNFISGIKLDTLKTAFESLSEVAEGIVVTVGELVASFGEKLAPVVSPILNGIIDMFGMLAGAIKEVWEYLNVAFIPALQTLIDEINIDWILEKIDNAVEACKKMFEGLIDFVLGVFTGDWSRAWSGIKDICTGAWEGIKNTFSASLDVITRIGKDLMGTLAEVFSPGWEKIKGIFSGAWSSIKSIFNWSNIKAFFTGVWSNIKSPFVTAGTWFSEKFNAVVKSIKTPFVTVTTFFTGVLTGIKNVFSTIPTWFKSKFQAAWTNVKNVFSSGGTVFTGIKDGILNGLKAVINALITGINDVIAVPFNGINAALQKIKDIKILGTKPFNFISTISVPKIPMLAQGGYVKANTPRLVMIGDNRHQGEVVAPENKMQEMADNAAMKTLRVMEEYTSAMMAGFEAVVEAIEKKDMNVSIGEEAIGEAADKYKTKQDIIKGGDI